MEQIRFSQLKKGMEFTDSFQHPRQTQRWMALVDARDTGEKLPMGNFALGLRRWDIQARNLLTGEIQVFNSNEHSRVEIPNKKAVNK